MLVFVIKSFLSVCCVHFFYVAAVVVFPWRLRSMFILCCVLAKAVSQSCESKLVVFYVESYSLGGRGLCVRVVHIGALLLGGGGKMVVALFCA